MKILKLVTISGRHDRQQAAEAKQAERADLQRAEALRRARNRAAVVAAAVASVPEPRRSPVHVPAQRSPVD